MMVVKISNNFLYNSGKVDRMQFSFAFTGRKKIKGKMKTIDAKKSTEPSIVDRRREPTASIHSISATVSYEEHFLRSLSPTFPAESRHRDSEFFHGKSFKKNRSDLCAKLFRIYNEKVFDSQVNYYYYYRCILL